MLVKLHGELRVECGETMRHDAPGVLGKNDANTALPGNSIRAHTAARVKRR
jgi:hypothetical protein